MDKTTRKMIKYLKTLPDCTYYWQTENPQTILPDEEFDNCASYMMRNGIAEKVTSFGNSGGFRLNHEYVHEKEFKHISKFHNFSQWFFHSFLGGVITGVLTTLLVEYLTSHGAELIAKSMSLLGIQ